MSKKERLAAWLCAAGFIRPLLWARPNSLVVLTYHRIRPDLGGAACGLDEGVFGPAQSVFEQQVRWLQRNFEVLSEADLLDVFRSGKRYRRGYAAITFDDGYRDNYDLAYPVLRACNAPAIFFVCPGMLEERRVGWWDIIAYFIGRSEQPAITVGGETLPLGTQKPAALRTLFTWMKKRPHAQTRNLLPELSEACRVAFPGRALQDAQLMTWDQVREVSRNGVAIGSHTYGHRVLATLEEADQKWELAESKSALERQLGSPVRTIAYPVGAPGNYTPATKRIAEVCGYDGAFSFHTGTNPSSHRDRFDIHRMAPVDEFNPSFICRAALPEVFA